MQIDVFFNVVSKKGRSLDDLRKYDSLLLDLLKQIFPCDNSYINKCQTSRGISEFSHKIQGSIVLAAH